jgi:methionine aminopeptidase
MYDAYQSTVVAMASQNKEELTEVKSINEYIDEGMVMHIKDSFKFFKYFIAAKLFLKWKSNYSQLLYNKKRSQLVNKFPFINNGYSALYNSYEELNYSISSYSFENCFDGKAYDNSELQKYKSHFKSQTEIVYHLIRISLSSYQPLLIG